MIHTPWSLGPIVPRCGMSGEHVRLHNGPCCVGVNSVCVCVWLFCSGNYCMQQWISTWLILKHFILSPFPSLPIKILHQKN